MLHDLFFFLFFFFFFFFFLSMNAYTSKYLFPRQRKVIEFDFSFFQFYNFSTLIKKKKKNRNNKTQGKKHITLINVSQTEGQTIKSHTSV